MVEDDGLVELVGGLQADAAGFAEEALGRGFVADQGDDDVAVVGGRLMVHHDEVVVVDAGVDHGVAFDAQQEVVVAAAQQGRHLDVVFDVLLGEDGQCRRRHLADERQRPERPRLSTSSSARGLVGSRRMKPSRSRLPRCAWTVEGDDSSSSLPISRTVGG